MPTAETSLKMEPNSINKGPANQADGVGVQTKQNGLNALHLASKEGHVEVVKELLERNCSVDSATKKGNTALHIASLAGHIEVVKMLIAAGASVNAQSITGFTPLYMAAQENHEDVVRYLLEKGANQSLATQDGFTPVAVAMQQGHDKIVALLLENDSKAKIRLPALHIAAKKDDVKATLLLLQNDNFPDVTSKSGFTPLHIAAHYGNTTVANILHQKGANINYQAKHNITPLHVAAKWGKLDMVAFLVEKGANIEARTRDGLTPLHCAARSGHQEVVEYLVDNKASICSKTKNGLVPLHMAAQGDHVEAAEVLLRHGAAVDEITVDYLTALHVAAHCGHVSAAKLLLEHKGDANARALNGFTPLHIACKKNRIKVVELLLKYGASLEATTESGLTPLHVASFMGCMNIVIYLLQSGANPDAATVRGETPLHLATRANHVDIIRVLLRNGANVNSKAGEDSTALHIASRLGNSDIAMLLIQHGASLTAQTKDLYTPLHITAKEGQEEVAMTLLEYGAPVTSVTKKGFTPLHLACKYGNLDIVRILLQKEETDINALAKNGTTALHLACYYEQHKVVLYLLSKGALQNVQAKNGHTPLHIAARKNQVDIVRSLLEYGNGDIVDIESKAGFTPLHLASQFGYQEVCSLLLANKADPNHRAKNGLTPMHLCAQEDRVNVATVLHEHGADVDPVTKGGFTPLHVASHYGHINMVRFLVQNGANINCATDNGYTPLHQAAQQGHTLVITLLLHHKAEANAVTAHGQTALDIAQKLGYISIVESLKVVTETTVTTKTVVTVEEKYRVVAPEGMQEMFITDSEDEGGEDSMISDHHQYRYMTSDDMKSFSGDDTFKIDVTRDERFDTKYTDMYAPEMKAEFSTSQSGVSTGSDNVDVGKYPALQTGLINLEHSLENFGILNGGNVSEGMFRESFLVSFVVDARGGAMRGCRHSGVRIIVPPRKAASPMRVTCRYLRKDKLNYPPPLMEGEALASRILELAPASAKFLGPVIIEVPHFASLRGKERELIVLRCDNGVVWKEHVLESNEEAVQSVLNESFPGEDLKQLEDLHTSRIVRILTTDFPQYFAIISRLRQEIHAIGIDGGVISSTAVPQVQALFPPNALTKRIKVGLQAQPIPHEIVTRLSGNSVAVSPIVTIEPRRRKFHKPITLTIPLPQAANKGMINQYSGDAPTLRLLCSITGGSSKALWEDVTGSTPLTFVKDCVSFTTTVSARFWLVDCRDINQVAQKATEIYNEANLVPFMAKFVVFAKKVDDEEALLRIFCMTDDKEEKTLEHQEHFTEVAKSRDIEVLENKPIYIEVAGNLCPILKCGNQLQMTFKAFKENRLPFTVRVRHSEEPASAKVLFLKYSKLQSAKAENLQKAVVCVLNVNLPQIERCMFGLQQLDVPTNNTVNNGTDDGESIHRADLRLSDICASLSGDEWKMLAKELGVLQTDIDLVEKEYPGSSYQQAMIAIKLWLQTCSKNATGNVLEKALRDIGREDIVKICMRNVEKVTDDAEKEAAKLFLDKDDDKKDHVDKNNSCQSQESVNDVSALTGPSSSSASENITEIMIESEKTDLKEDSDILKDVIWDDDKQVSSEEKVCSPKEKKDKMTPDIDNRRGVDFENEQAKEQTQVTNKKLAIEAELVRDKNEKFDAPEKEITDSKSGVTDEEEEEQSNTWGKNKRSKDNQHEGSDCDNGEQK